MFIRLTKLDDTPMYVNMDHILTFFKADTYTYLRGSNDEDWYAVKETTDEIMAKLRDKKWS